MSLAVTLGTAAGWPPSTTAMWRTTEQVVPARSGEPSTTAFGQPMSYVRWLLTSSAPRNVRLTTCALQRTHGSAPAGWPEKTRSPRTITRIARRGLAVAKRRIMARDLRALSILIAAIHTTESPTSEGARTENSEEHRRAVSRKDRPPTPGASRGEHTKRCAPRGTEGQVRSSTVRRPLIHFVCSCEKPTCLRAIVAEPPADAAPPPSLPPGIQRLHRSATQARRRPAIGG